MCFIGTLLVCGTEFISVKCPFKPRRTCMLAASYRLRMAHSSSSSPLLLSTGAQLPAPILILVIALDAVL